MSGIFSDNDERVHHYQRGRASITRLGLWLVKIFETERLAVVARRGLLAILFIDLRWE